MSKQANAWAITVRGRLVPDSVRSTRKAAIAAVQLRLGHVPWYIAESSCGMQAVKVTIGWPS